MCGGLTNTIYDVAIIGAGAVGSAIARELSRYDLSVVMLESNPDVGMGTSKASTAIWHTGFDAKPSSLEATLMRRSYPLMEAFMQEVGSPYERIGGLLIAWNQEQLDTLPILLDKAHKNGVADVHLISKEEVYQCEPHLGDGALGGMLVPGEGILCTFTIPLACATQAVINGVTLKLNFRVAKIERNSESGRQDTGCYVVSSKEDAVSAKWVINAAGLYSDDINNLFGHGNFKVTPRRGELIVYDKLSRQLVNHVLLPVPTATTKGVLVSPTIYGNVLLGPTAEDLPDKTATNTSANGLSSLIEKGKKILPELLDEEVTATYSGLRAATEHSDYQIALHTDQKYICVGGIRSTGISASLGIAEYVADLVKEGGVELKLKPEFKTIRMPNIGEAFTRPYQDEKLIAENPDYGKIICYCERVTLGELKDATCSDIPATTLDALRRRTRAMQGRCQGFNCQATLLTTLTQTKELATEHIESTEKQIKNSVNSVRSVVKTADVIIVGAGPAGMAAALELKRLGVDGVVIAERESEVGGIPRLCGHTGFGLRDFHQVMTGPNYSRKYRELVQEANLVLRVGTYVSNIDNQNNNQEIKVSYTSPDGIGAIGAKSVLLATGVRERPRSARLVPGHRPQGVFTTGSLQRFVFEQHLPVGKKAVIVGAEIVSLSVVTTLLHAGVKVVGMVSELPRHQLYMPILLPAKIFYADILAHAPILTNKRVTNIFGRQRVEGIEITDLDSGKTETIDCDTVVFTGDWIPENELARRGGVETLKTSLGPQVDGMFRTSQRGFFAAGNLLRGVETADWAALEGRAAARSMARWLENAQWSASRLGVEVEAPISWICPNVLSPDVQISGFRFWSNEFRHNVTLQLKQGERVLYEKRIGWLKANVALNLSSEWLEKVDYEKEPVKLVIHS